MFERVLTFQKNQDGFTVSQEVLEATELVFNYSMLPEFTESSRLTVSTALDDFMLTEIEKADVIQALTWAGLSDAEPLVDAMEDGYISPRELALLDVETYEARGSNILTKDAHGTAKYGCHNYLQDK